MLEVRNLCAGYGPIRVLRQINLEIPSGKIVSVIGGNGAGKTTLLMTLCGVLPASEGDVLLDGKSIVRWPTDQIVRAGIVQVPEGRRIFAHLTVRENLELGAFALGPRAKIQPDLENVFEIFPVLKERTRQLAGTLSG